MSFALGRLFVKSEITTILHIPTAFSALSEDFKLAAKLQPTNIFCMSLKIAYV